MTRRYLRARSNSIKGRLLRIAFLPCLVAVVLGALVSGYLVRSGLASLSYADQRDTGMGATSAHIKALSVERATTLGYLAGREDLRPAMIAARAAVDRSTVDFMAYADEILESVPQIQPQIDLAIAFIPQWQEARAQVDAGQADVGRYVALYNNIFDTIAVSSKRLSYASNSAAAAFEQVVTSDTFVLLEAVNRANALAGYVFTHDDPELRTQFGAMVGLYHVDQHELMANWTDASRAAFTRLRESPEWATLIAGDAALIADERFDFAARSKAAEAVSGALSAIYIGQADHSSTVVRAEGRDALRWSLAAAVVVALAALGAALAAYVGANRLVRRITALRTQTLDITERELPQVLAQVNAGESAELENPVPRIDFGTDELGEVARAFDKAQSSATAAAVAEVHTRRAASTVFLNIAHRSQALVHRQLQFLDQIERSEDNPELVDRLFQLDHLTTRARRNAENLIILGGESVGRQWRRPVPLADVLRGAVSETKDYTRVDTGPVPDVALNGSCVADIGHLLAELVDNGTAFSPPQAKVYVRSAITGRGIVVEVEDQGLGMSAERCTELNELLSEPGDIGVLSLVGETRVGLYVVATLAAKHGARVTLRESAYGGIHAIVLLPSALIAAPEHPAPEQPVPAPTEPTGIPECVPNGYEAFMPGASAQHAAPEPVTYRAEPDGYQPRGPVDAEPPPLPTRVRQSDIAPQLRQEPTPSAGSTPNAERSSAALSAFQRGTARARTEANTGEFSINGAEW
ncbi:ATP-binding protein [Nocardia sp. NPDC058658]|uniref:ATP-binding protein n=1 Tax=Nocardia sp. NPDC058658 TaxID=3346580 RepID=UPI003658DD6E